MDSELLVETHMHIVPIIVDKLLSTQGYRQYQYMRDEMLSEGYLKLTETSRSFNPNMGATFETYASRRIHGSLLHLTKREYRRRHLEADIDITTLNVPVPEPEEDDLSRLSLVELLEPRTKIQQEVYYRVILNGETAQSVANSLGIRVSTVKKEKFKLIKRFRKEIKEWQL